MAKDVVEVNIKKRIINLIISINFPKKFFYEPLKMTFEMLHTIIYLSVEDLTKTLDDILQV